MYSSHGIDSPILRVPTLAIHLDRSANDAFKFNTESQLTPVLATAAKTYVNIRLAKSDLI